MSHLMPRIGEFEIKREEKYFVFTSMSRQERVLTKKMAPSMACTLPPCVIVCKFGLKIYDEDNYE